MTNQFLNNHVQHLVPKIKVSFTYQRTRFTRLSEQKFHFCLERTLVSSITQLLFFLPRDPRAKMITYRFPVPEKWDIYRNSAIKVPPNTSLETSTEITFLGRIRNKKKRKNSMPLHLFNGVHNYASCVKLPPFNPITRRLRCLGR